MNRRDLFKAAIGGLLWAGVPKPLVALIDQPKWTQLHAGLAMIQCKYIHGRFIPDPEPIGCNAKECVLCGTLAAKL